MNLRAALVGCWQTIAGRDSASSEPQVRIEHLPLGPGLCRAASRARAATGMRIEQLPLSPVLCCAATCNQRGACEKAACERCPCEKCTCEKGAKQSRCDACCPSDAAANAAQEHHRVDAGPGALHALKGTRGPHGTVQEQKTSQHNTMHTNSLPVLLLCSRTLLARLAAPLAAMFKNSFSQTGAQLHLMERQRCPAKTPW